MPDPYDVFLSYDRADAVIARPLRDALIEKGLAVFFDESEIEDFQGITSRLDVGLARSKALLAVYSETYPTRRACQFELTAAFLAAQRTGDPRARVLVVNPEQAVGHIEPVELRDALFARLETPEAAADVAAHVARQVRELGGVLGDIGSLGPVRWYGRQPVRSRRFVGRVTALWAIHSTLQASELRPLTGVVGPVLVQLVGLGGIGKTLLAEEYGLRFAAAYPGGVFWLTALGGSPTEGSSRAEREAERARQVRALAVEVGAPVAGLTDSDVQAALRQELEHRGKTYLWVIDDVPDGLEANELWDWLAPHPLGKTLLTTRSRTYDVLGGVVEPGVLASHEAIELLTHRRYPSDDAERQQAARLAEDLGFHPLALEVAGAALAVAAGPTPYAEFRRALADPSEDELAFAAELTGTVATGHDPSIATTLLSSIAGLGEEGTDLLRLASLLANAPIPSTLVDRVFAVVDGLDQRDARRRALRARYRAERASLAEAEGDGAAESIQPARQPHHPVRRATQTTTYRAAASRSSWRARRATGDVASVLLLLTTSSAHYSRPPPCRRTRRRSGARALWHPSRATTTTTAASAAHASFKQQVLEGLRQLLGEQHDETLRAMGDLAQTLAALGDLDSARELQEQVLEGLRQLLGEQHDDTLRAMGNLAQTLAALGDLDGARELQEQVLEGLRQLLGEQHDETLRAMGDLAQTLAAQATSTAHANFNSKCWRGCGSCSVSSTPTRSGRWATSPRRSRR